MCDHDSIKRDPDRWSALPFVGMQSGYDSLGTRLEMRNCSCGSTLCKPVRLALCMDALLTRELAIAAREGLEWELCRVWLREQAIKELREEMER
jgi:hypothetical protein